MKTCFVSMPVGQQQDRLTGAVIDFDLVYAELVAPALERASLSARSWRSADAGTSIQKQALGDIISSDILLADITTANPNVMYELGVRHAANRGPTVLLRGGHGQPPFYVGYLQAIVYDPLADLAEPEPLRARLSEALRSAARRSEGSPLYEFFPALRVELPADLVAHDREHRVYPERVKRTLSQSRSSRSSKGAADVAAAEEALRTVPDAAPAAYLDLLRAYRDRSDWNGLIRAASTLPPDVEADPQTMQLLALALNRRSESGDQERAVALMRRLIDETGGDAETFGIIGRIHKERWKGIMDPADLKDATRYYRRAFDLQPTDFYTGFNAASLLFLQNDAMADAELAVLLPRVKDALQPHLITDDADYWALSTAIEVAVIERNWSDAQQFVERALAVGAPQHAFLTSVDSIERLGSRLHGGDAQALAAVVQNLKRGPQQEDDGDADL